MVEKLDVILKRKLSLPLSSQGASSSDNILKHILQTKEILKREYLERQLLAIEALDKCLALVRQEKEDQSQDLRCCQEQQQALLIRINATKSKYDAAYERQKQLSDRVERVVSSLNHIQPSLSESEVEMKDQLLDVKENIEIYKNSLRELNVRREYQEKVNKSFSSDSTPSSKKVIEMEPQTERDVRDIKKFLAEQ